jgi:tetratricopeptide (TPR) repeat protein
MGEYTSLFEEGKKLAREGKYEAALEPLQAAKAVNDTKDVTRWIETCQRDGKGKKLLEQAKRLAGAGSFEQALETLKKVDELSSFAEEAKTLGEKYEESRIKQQLEAVRKLARDGNVAEAREMMAKLPPERASELEPEIAEAARQFEKDKAHQAVAAANAAERERQRRAAAARAEVDNALSAVYRKVDQGNFDGAIREIERVLDSGASASIASKCRLLKKNIPPFGQLYNDGVGKYNGGSYEAAASSLLRALMLLREMDINSSLENGLKEKAAKSVSIKGRSALNRQDYGTAAKAFRDSLQLSPGNAEATNGLAEISRRATDVYMEGYTAMTAAPDIAKKKFETVLEMAPPDSKPYLDAKKRLRELGN